LTERPPEWGISPFAPRSIAIALQDVLFRNGSSAKTVPDRHQSIMDIGASSGAFSRVAVPSERTQCSLSPTVRRCYFPSPHRCASWRAHRSRRSRVVAIRSRETSEVVQLHNARPPDASTQAVQAVSW